VEPETRAESKPVEKTHTDQIGLFTGSAEAEERASLLTSSIPIIETDGARD